MRPRTLHISRRNSTFQVLESLIAKRQKRHATRTFVVEGVQPINTALAQGWQFETVIHERGAELSRWAQDVIARSSPPVAYEVVPELLADLSRKDDRSELLAVVRMREDDVGRIPVGRDLAAAVIDTPSNPGNLGTLIRSCDAFGIHGLIVTGHAVDVYDPATIAASRGSLFAVPVVRAASHAAVAAWIAAVRQAVGACRVVGADEQGEVDVSDCDFAGPAVVIFGNEARGLSRAYQELCDLKVRIPIVGSATSLNVSVAASVVFYEISRQRRRFAPSLPQSSRSGRSAHR
jgi:TrmH family RNA methyltransferase